MAVTFASSADKRGIPRDEVLWAMTHGKSWERWEDERPPHGPTQLWIGPSRFGMLEVIAEVTPPRDINVFHVMPLRQSTAEKVGYTGEETP